MIWHRNGLAPKFFSKLQRIHINNCNNLRHIFPSNVVIALVSLNTLVVESCYSLEGIFEMESSTFKLPKNDAQDIPLVEVNLKHLPNLKYVWNNDLSKFLNLSKLRDVIAINCPRLQSLFPASLIKHVQQLQNLVILGIHEMFSKDKTFEIGQSKSMLSKIVFPKLSGLSMDTKAMTRNFWLTQFSKPGSFSNLRNLSLMGSYDEDMTTLPLEMNQMLYSIKVLNVSFASQLLQIFSNNPTQRCANLKKLTLSHLPNLTHVWEDNTQTNILFDNLEAFHVEECGKLKCLAPSSISFSNLKYLSVDHCHELMNLLTLSIAKSLAKLEKMSVCDCQGMTSILGKGEGEVEGKDEIVFGKLVELKVDDLPRLESFHFGRCTVKFPCLKKLIISKCGELKLFSHGIVSTPELQYLKIRQHDKVQVSPKHGINFIIHNIWLEDDCLRSISSLFT